MWKQKMSDVTSMSAEEVFETIYLECGIKIQNNKVIEGNKRLSKHKLHILNEIYKRSGYKTCNPYALK